MINFKKIPLIIIIGISLLFVPSALINQDFLHKQMDKVLKLKIRDAYRGGERLYRFSDPLGDDNGGGALTYPRNSKFEQKGSLDLLTFSIHKPQTEEDWADENIYWQFSYRFKKLGNSFVLSHYLGFRGSELESSIETNNPRAELVTFNKNYPWHFVININGEKEKAEIVSADGMFKTDVPIIMDIQNNTVIVRVPLNYKPLRFVFTKPGSYHYVMAGVYDYLSTSNYLPVKKRSSLRNGGGSSSPLTPKIYDYITPKGYNQNSILNSYNEDDFEYAVLEPLLAFSELIEDMESEITEEQLIKSITALRYKNRVEVIPVTDYQKAVELFNIGDNIESEQLLNRLLLSEPDNPLIMAYLGSITAMNGGKSKSISKSMELIYQAYDLFDSAMDRVTNIEEELTVRLNRGNVSKAIPESVFHKSEIGAQDFLRVVDIYKELNQNNYIDIANCYVNAALCLKELGKFEESQIYLDVAMGLIVNNSISE